MVILNLLRQFQKIRQYGFYDLLAQYPGFMFTAGVATITGLLFYVTSADSGALVLGNFTTKFTNIEHDSPRWLSVFLGHCHRFADFGNAHGEWRDSITEHHDYYGSAF